MTSSVILPIRQRWQCRDSFCACLASLLHALELAALNLQGFIAVIDQLQHQKYTAVDNSMAEAFKSLLGDKLLGTDAMESICGEGKTVGLYFSAHWCPPCRGFTPKLAEFYKKHHTEKNFEIVFVSSDKNDAEFQEYYKEMPWLALPFADRGRKVSLLKLIISVVHKDNTLINSFTFRFFNLQR